MTPQWNVCVDNWFTTIVSSVQDLPDFTSEEWSRLFGTITCHFPDSQDGPNGESMLPDAFRIKTEPSYTGPLIMSPDEVPTAPISNRIPSSNRMRVPQGHPETPSCNPEDVSQSTMASRPPRSVKFRSPTVTTTHSPTPERPATVTTSTPAPLPKPSAIRNLQTYNNPGKISDSPAREHRLRKPPVVMNYDTMGGLAEHLKPEIAVTQDEVEVITSHCIAHLAACGVEGAHDLPVTPEVRACLTRLEEMTPLQVASVFKAAKKTNPDTVSYTHLTLPTILLV